jgi:hypothetical protein
MLARIRRRRPAEAGFVPPVKRSELTPEEQIFAAEHHDRPIP